jgi:predicted aspartyl protease/tetratricopeptide (TPR) repeat protein
MAATLLIAQGLLTLPANCAFGALPTTQTDEKGGRDLLNAVITAFGGPTKLKEMRDHPIRAHATIGSSSSISSAANSYECDVLEKADKMRIEMTMLGMPMIIAYDGKNGWTQYGDWVTRSTSTTTQMLADELKHGLAALADAIDQNSQVQALPKRTLNGKLCGLLKVTSPEGKSTTFYVDPITHLIARAEYAGTDHELGTQTLQAVEYSDYRPVAGSQHPFRIVQYSGSKKKSETEIKSIDADVAIDDKVFQMPPESEIARLKDGPVTVPFEYTGNEILVKVRINNGPEQKFILDTGASQSVLDKSAAQALGPYPVSTFSVTSGSKAVPLSYTKVSSLALGDIMLNEIPVLITDLSKVQDHPAGLIGANILRRFAVTIDYDNKKLLLADPKNVSVAPGSITLPTMPVFGATALVVNGELNGKNKLNFLVDTGASFNNLPSSTAKDLHTGPLMPVGQIYGLDQQKLDIGSVKLDSLKIGTLNITSPVFMVAPDESNSATAGLFTAGAMGILGNPIWSQFVTTIDYRNDRLILESPPGREKIVQYSEQLDKIDRQYMKTREIDEAIKSYEKVLAATRADGIRPAEALAVGRIAGCYADKFLKTKESHWLDDSAREFDRAYKIAEETRNKSVQGQLMAQWALMYLNAPRSQNDIVQAQGLLAKALQKAPMEPSIYAALGATLIKVGKKPEGATLLDRAVVLDPSNWQALWAKYNLFLADGKAADQALVAAQLQHYYGDVPEVIALGGARAAASKSSTQAGAKSGAKPGTKPHGHAPQGAHKHK